MELWVRSQDKNELCKVNRLFLGGSEEKTICATVNETIGVTFLGGYKTKERALEVLDEIQEFLTLDEDHYEGLNKVSYQQCNMYKSNILMIYEMSKE